MDVIILITRGILEQGLIYAILAFGIYITYKILDYPDLSVDGTFPLGAAISAVLIMKGINPWIVILISFLAGTAAGLMTGLFHVVFRIKDLLSGIITMTGLYSINLMIAKKAVLPITGGTTIFNSGLASMIPERFSKYKTLLVIVVCTFAIKKILDWYLKTKSGLLLRAAGDNETMITLVAKDKGLVKIIGLMLGNGLAAAAGSILCQQQRFFEATMGTGMMVMGLASVIIGISIFRKVSFMAATTMALFGSVLYKACLSIALNLKVDPNYLKLLMALLFLGALVSRDLMERGGRRQNANSQRH